MNITYDAKNVIVVSKVPKVNSTAYYVLLYEIGDLRLIFEQLIGDPLALSKTNSLDSPIKGENNRGPLST